MTPLSLLNWMLLSTGLLGAWWACYRLALRHERSFGYNRAYLVLGPLLAVTLPLLPLAWPAGWWGPGPTGLAGMAVGLLPTVAVRAPGMAAASAGFDWSFWLWAAYLAGAALVLLRLAAGLGRLWWQARGLPRTAADGYTRIDTHGRLPTSSFGHLVFWNEALPLSPAEARQVLAHELAHVRQHHTYDRLLLELLRAALWFNPFAHLCARALALTHEYLADAAALQHSSLPVPSASTSYSQLLARQVASRLGFSVPLAHSFSHSQTLRRIAMIQKTNSISRWKQWLALPLLGVLLVAVACEKTVPPAEPQQSIELQKIDGQRQLAVQNGASSTTPPPPVVYEAVEQMPELPGGGGPEAIVRSIQQHIIYPKLPAAQQRTGRVFASFIVTDKGEVQAGKIIKGLSAPYDEAVLAAIRQLPNFEPGKKEGKAVNVSFTVPLLFVGTVQMAPNSGAQQSK